MKQVPNLNAEDIAIYQSLVGASALKERLENNLLPVVKIADDLFYINWSQNKILPRGNVQSPGLDMKNGGWVDSSTHERCFYYDTIYKKETKISPDITALPENVVLIKVPPARAIDPVGAAQAKGLDPTAFLKRYPIKMYLEAQVIPLEETVLVDIIDVNKTKKQSEQLRQDKNKSGNRQLVKKKNNPGKKPGMRK